MLTTTGGRRQRGFWVVVASAWIAMLAFTAATQAHHILIVPAWGILVAALGIGLLVDHEHAVWAYRRGMPASVSIAYVRGVVTLSGAMLTVIGILMMALGGVRIWGEL
jgi:hypothetical protein